MCCECEHANALRTERFQGTTASKPSGKNLTAGKPSFFAFRPQRYGRFSRQKPSLLICNCNRAGSAVAQRVAGPECFPLATSMRREQRFRRRVQDLALSKVHEQKPVVVFLREVSENQLAGPSTAPSIPPEPGWRKRESSRRNFRRWMCRS